MTFGRGMLEHWTIDPDTTYLNHGTVGVAPRCVMAAQQAIRDEMERQPARFMLRQVSHLVGAPTGEPQAESAEAETRAALARKERSRWQPTSGPVL